MYVKQKTVKEKLSEALFELLKTKSYQEISITDLHQAAGVSRISFYRNYDEPDQILEEALNNQIKEWATVLRDKDRLPNWPEFQSALLLLQPLIEIIYAKGAQSALYKFIKHFGKTFDFKHGEEPISRSLQAGLYFGLIDYWASNGFGEFDEDMKSKFTIIQPLSLKNTSEN